MLNGSLSDVAGLRVGHVQAIRRGWRTGTTVIVASHGAVAGVDVRGGAPGTRETDLLRPENMVQQVHAICLTGGSAYGLAAADGVMAALEERGVGFPVGLGAGVVPIVPAAVIYDLGRGGRFDSRPNANFGYRAVANARVRPWAEGAVGAGAGALAGGLQGGVGTASVQLPNGVVVSAIAVVNSAGSIIDPATALPWERGDLLLRRPDRDDRRRLSEFLARDRQPLNTTIGVVATSMTLDKAECTKFAGVAQDGLARAIRPAHSMLDGDTVFALSTGSPGVQVESGARERAVALSTVFEAGAACFAAACTRAVVLATSHRGGPPSYRDLCPSAWPAAGGR